MAFPNAREGESSPVSSHPNSVVVKVQVGRSRGRGRGVFATAPIAAGEVIERSPVIAIPKKHWKHIEKTVLGDYAFDWGRDLEDVAIVLGYGMIYNHSPRPNARFDFKLREKIYEFIALRDIEPGEEIFTNYNGDPTDKSPLWFEKARA